MTKYSPLQKVVAAIRTFFAEVWQVFCCATIAHTPQGLLKTKRWPSKSETGSSTVVVPAAAKLHACSSSARQRSILGNFTHKDIPLMDPLTSSSSLFLKTKTKKQDLFEFHPYITSCWPTSNLKSKEAALCSLRLFWRAALPNRQQRPAARAATALHASSSACTSGSNFK